MLATYPLPENQIRHLPKSDFYFTISTQDESGWNETAHRRRQWLPATRNNFGRPDTYFSQAFFRRPRRRKVSVAAISHSWVDLDVYRTEYAGLRADQAAQTILNRIRDDCGIPPTSIISSGRGLYGVWAFNRVIPGAAAAKIEALNRELARKFNFFGADQRAVDVTRVLRIPGTVNGKSNAKVDIIFNSGTAYEFNELADEVLPYTRAEIDEARHRREAARKSFDGSRLPSTAVRFDRISWSCAVLDDMQTLADKRWGGTVPDGQRDIWVFIAAVHLAWRCSPDEIFDETAEIATAWGIAPSWIEKGRYLHSVIDRANRAVAGEKIDWNGQSRDARYRFTASTLIEWLKIEPWEMEYLTCLIDQNERNRRKRNKRAIKSASKKEIQMAAVNEIFDGNSVAAVASKYDIDQKTLWRWRNKLSGEK